MSAEDIKKRFTVEGVLQEHGVKVIGGGNQRMAKCPFHEDSTPSLSINVGTQLWNCHGCKEGGDVINLLAKLQGKSVAQVLKDNGNGQAKPFKFPTASAAPEKLPDEPSAIYHYLDQLGHEVYQVCRYRLSDGKKTFRQRHQSEGKWTWSMEGVTRVLYRLPEVLKGKEVWVVEGEKDADNVSSLGFCGTCNVGGAGKWLDSYSDCLKGKELVLCGDNDDPGRLHMKAVFASVSTVAASVRLVTVPAPSKDVSDYIATFTKPGEAREALVKIAAEAHPHIQGYELPLYTIAELEPFYERYAKAIQTRQLDLGRWLPSFRRHLRPLGPGEMVVIAAATGAGKTAILQNIAKCAAGLPSVFFEAELSKEMLFERSVQVTCKQEGAFVESAYVRGETVGPESLSAAWPKLVCCTVPGLTVEKLSEYTRRSELKLGERPKLVIVDYFQLLRGLGKSRYERFSDIAEGLRRLAVETNVVLLVTSQIQRPGEEATKEVGLHSGKETGSIENSASLFLGVWRDENDGNLIHIRICKSTKGGAGSQIKCNFDVKTLNITERAETYGQDHGIP